MKKNRGKKNSVRSKKLETHGEEEFHRPPGKQARPDGKMSNLTVSPFLDPDSENAKRLLSSDEGEVNLGPNSEIRKMLKKTSSKKRRQHDQAIKKGFREEFS